MATMAIMMPVQVPVPIFNVPCAPAVLVPQRQLPRKQLPSQASFVVENHVEVSDVPRLPRPWAQTLEFHRNAHLGCGSFAKLYQVREKETGEKSALKVMQRHFYANRQMEPQLNMEIEAMRKCASLGRTNHIVKLLDYIEENGLVFLRMELCTISLEAHALQQPGRRIPEGECAPWARQLCHGLQDMHSLGIVHRDIKPENLLLSLDGKLKIVDFGWCAYIGDLRRSKAALAGTFQFMAPEILEEKPQTEAVDMWSAGATLLELLTGQPLITSIQHPTGHSASCPRQAAKIRTSRVLTEIRQKCPLPQHCRPGYLSSQCWAFCQGLLMPQASTRLSLQGAINHAWLHRGMPRSRSWTPQPSGPSVVNNVVVHDWRLPRTPPSNFEHPRSWDGSTTASSSGSTPRAPMQWKVEGGHAPTLQVSNWPSVAPQLSWQPSVKPPLMPVLLASPNTVHRM